MRKSAWGENVPKEIRGVAFLDASRVAARRGISAILCNGADLSYESTAA